MQPAPLEKEHARALWPLVLILLLAAALRLSGAATRSVWTDEGWTAWAARDHRPSVILDKLAGDRHPPLYTLALSAWWSVVGPSHIALRFPAIAAGVLSVAVTYRIGADWLGRRAAWFAALVLAALPLAVYYTTEIRLYGWLLLSVTLMTFFFLRMLRAPALRYAALYALSVAFMFYTLYLGALALAVQGAVGLLLWRGTLRQKAGLVGSWLGALVLFAPWLAVMLSQQGVYLTEGIGGFPGSIESTRDNLLPVARYLFSPQMALVGGAYAIALALWREPLRTLRGTAWATILLGGAGLALAMWVANMWFGVLAARTLSFLTPLIALGAGAGLALLDRRAGAILGLAWLVATVADPGVIQPRLPGDQVAAAVAGGYSAGDVVVLETGWDDNAFLYEIERALPGRDPRVIRTLPWVDHRLAAQESPLDHLDGTLEQARRTWVVQWLQPGQVLAALDEGAFGYRRVQTVDVPLGADYAALYPEHPTVEVALFERPQFAADPLLFGEVLALHDAILPPEVPPGGRLHVDLWWAARAPLSRDYSVGVYLLPMDADTVLAQDDAAPGGSATTTWAAGVAMFDRHTLLLPDDLPPGEYRVALTVYWYGDMQPLAVEGGPRAVIGTVAVR
jgi:hypothetical protein